MLQMPPMSIFIFFSHIFYLQFAAFVTVGHSQNEDHFISPPPTVERENWSDNIVYHIGENAQIQWEASDLTHFSALICQVHWANTSSGSSAILMGVFYILCSLFEI